MACTVFLSWKSSKGETVNIYTWSNEETWKISWFVDLHDIRTHAKCECKCSEDFVKALLSFVKVYKPIDPQALMEDFDETWGEITEWKNHEESFRGCHEVRPKICQQ